MLNAEKTGKSSVGTRNYQAGKSLPVVLIGVVAVIMGALAYTSFSGSSNSNQEVSDQSTNADNVALASLQENLQTSLALPTDFRTIQEFELLNADAQPVTQQVFDDKWSLIFFGFTHCPDVCPITLQVMKDVVAQLEDKQQTPPQVVFVSIDPARDTAPIMKKYIGYFDEEFVGITGDVNAVLKFTSSLGIVASFTANESDPENYGVDHTASLLLVDPQRRVRAKITPPHEAGKIVSDLLVLTAAPS